MPVHHTVAIPCRDTAFRDRNVHLGRVRRGVSLRVPIEENAILDLAQAEQLYQRLGEAIKDVRAEVFPTGDPTELGAARPEIRQ